MTKGEHIRRASADAIRRQLAREGSKTDWDRVRSLPAAEVERLADDEDGPLPVDWERQVELGVPEPKLGVHIRLDAEVLRWFKARGPGYQTRINAVLRAFVTARQRAER